MEKRGEIAILTLDWGEVLPDWGEVLSAETEQQVRLASIVAIDVVGFSKISSKDQHRAARNVQSLRTRIESCAQRAGGRVFNTAGDGFMLEFPSAGAAFGCISELIDKRPKGEPPIRVGAHVGDVIVTITNDLLGHGVNVAARLQSLAMPGSALVSGEFRSMARNSPQAAFLSRGRQPLDNIDEKVQTYAILSPKQRFGRQARLIGVIAAVLAVLGSVPFVLPHAVNLAHTLGISDASLEQLNISLPAFAQPPAPPSAAPGH
jgi:class 3 adenylate cyclase